jgi:7-carboxy-7-deazaguanine synthase
VALVEYLQRERLNGVRVQLQLHKFIWDPEKRGV